MASFVALERVSGFMYNWRLRRLISEETAAEGATCSPGVEPRHPPAFG